MDAAWFNQNNFDNSKLKVRNLGPLKDVEVDIKKFNVIIGKQGNGKSTICKLVYFFKRVKEIFIENIYQHAGQQTTSDFLNNTYRNINETFNNLIPKSMLKETTYIEYTYSDKNKVKVNKEGLIIIDTNITDSIAILFKEVERCRRNNTTKDLSKLQIDNTQYYNHIKK